MVSKDYYSLIVARNMEERLLGFFLKKNRPFPLVKEKNELLKVCQSRSSKRLLKLYTELTTQIFTLHYQ